MIPVIGEYPPERFEITERPSKTYRIDFANKRIDGTVSGLDAVRQTVYQILSTERYETIIFSWNYGAEMKSLFGRPQLYVQSEIKRRIREALTQDDRIEGVDAFEFERNAFGLSVKFTVHTTAGDIESGTEVSVGV